MAHYFDDVFHRDAGPGHHRKKPHMRRSSTARSIGARSDFESSINGDDDDANSVTALDPEREAERREADAHMRHYISEQLERVKAHQDHEGYKLPDEYETQA